MIRRKRSVLMADIDPNMLTSRLTYLPLEMCAIFEGTQPTDVQQRVKNVETLLVFLLEREEEDWPMDLVKGLQETNQSPIAHMLQREVEAIAKENKELEEKFKQRMKERCQVDSNEVSLSV